MPSTKEILAAMLADIWSMAEQELAEEDAPPMSWGIIRKLEEGIRGDSRVIDDEEERMQLLTMMAQSTKLAEATGFGCSVPLSDDDGEQVMVALAVLHGQGHRAEARRLEHGSGGRALGDATELPATFHFAA